MKLMTEELKKQIPELYSQDGKGDEAIVYAHYFDIISGWDWYALEYDDNDKLFFGIVRGFVQEYGYFSLTEFESLGFRLERDLYWEPKTVGELKTLKRIS